MANNNQNGNGNVNPAPQQNANAGANGQQGQAQASQPTPAATNEEKKGGIFERLGKQMDKAIPILSKVVIGAALLGLGYVLGNGSRGPVDSTPQIPPTIPDNTGAGTTDSSTNYGAF